MEVTHIWGNIKTESCLDEGGEWSHMAVHVFGWWAFVNAGMNLLVLIEGGKFNEKLNGC